MDTKHTPGLWHVARGMGNFPVIEGAKYVIANLSFCGETLGTLRGNVEKAEEIEANARLIAAAPDMLEVFKKIADIQLPCVENQELRLAMALDFISYVRTEARAAIAKAEGRD